MSRETFVFRNGELVEKYGPMDVRPVAPRSALPAPMYICDHMPAAQSMVDGRTYESKSAMRAGYREAGAREGTRYVEIGNEAPPAPSGVRDKITRDEIGSAFQKVRDGYKPAPLQTEGNDSWMTD